MLQWRLEKIHLDLKFDWSISRQTSQFKENFIVHVSDGTYSAIGEIAPNTRYGESTKIIESEFNSLSLTLQKIKTVDDILELCSLNKIKNALSFGIESAFVHLLCKQQRLSINDYFRIPKPKRVFTSFSLPIMPIDQIGPFLSTVPQFKSYKIKVNSENAIDVVKTVIAHTDKPLRIDANESFKNSDELKQFLSSVNDSNIDFIEQPMPASMGNDYVEIKKVCPHTLIADESIESKGNFERIKQQFDGINVKLMKAGSYTNAIQLLVDAKQHQLKTMIGCMIETSLGISSALNLCGLVDYVDLDGSLIIKNDPFHFIDEIDGELFSLYS